MGIPSVLSASQVAQLLILRNFWASNDNPWKDAEFTPAELEQQWQDNWGDIENFGVQNDVRYHGTRVPYDQVRPRIHPTWERHYDVEVRVINLGDDRGLAYNYVSGGGKHGDPDSFPWFNEAWFVKCTGTKTVTTHTYKDIPEVKDEPV